MCALWCISGLPGHRDALRAGQVAPGRVENDSLSRDFTVFAVLTALPAPAPCKRPRSTAVDTEPQIPLGSGRPCETNVPDQDTSTPHVLLLVLPPSVREGLRGEVLVGMPHGALDPLVLSALGQKLRPAIAMSRRALSRLRRREGAQHLEHLGCTDLAGCEK